MKFYIVVINGLDLVIIGPFDYEENAMPIADLIMLQTEIVRTSTSIEQSGAHVSWEQFCQQSPEFVKRD